MRYSPRKSIKVKCLDCSCGSLQEVQKCPIKDCALWPYRWGAVDFENAIFPPKFWPKKREVTEEQQKAIEERLRQMREKKAKKTKKG